MIDRQRLHEGYAEARKAYLAKEKEKKKRAEFDYQCYRHRVSVQQWKGTYRSNKPKGVKA